MRDLQQYEQQYESEATDRAGLLEEMERARSRREAVSALELADRYLAEQPQDEEVAAARKRLGDREEWRFYLKYYAPTALAAYLAIGSASGRWDVSVVAAAVVAFPLSLIVGGFGEVLRRVLRQRPGVGDR